MIKINSY